MIDKMTEQEFFDLITTQSAKTVLGKLSRLPINERRAYAKPALTLFDKLDLGWFDAERLRVAQVKDGDAVTIAVLATASGSELKAMSFFPSPIKVSLEEIVRKLQPNWLQQIVDHFVIERGFCVGLFRPLWQAGLCERPDSDAIILEYYNRWSRYSDADEEELLSGDVWRFFEVEGGGEDSLANHDKYLNPDDKSWAERLKRYSDDGKLDRQRLLDASLDALERDFGQYRAGWYSRFHVLMAPDGTEMKARADRYLKLLASSIPPTVSFALKHVQTLDKAGTLDATALLAALDPALQARSKGTVATALKLLQNAARRRPELRAEAASKAVLALISEDAGVQEKALDVIGALGSESVYASLTEYVELVAPSVRARIAAMAGLKVQPESAAEIELIPMAAQPLPPVTSSNDALAIFLSVLEDSRDPFEVERAIDGISRFGTKLQGDETALSPLRKRARQVCKSTGGSDVRLVLALSGRALAEDVGLEDILADESKGRDGYAFSSGKSLQVFHIARNIAVVSRVKAGHAVPLLSLPSETSGLVGVADLLSRMALYRKAGVAPDPKDLALALMRLDPDERPPANIAIETEADRAVAYALGAKVKVGPTPELWAAAWRARLPEEADDEVTRLFKERTPDCGVPANIKVIVSARHSDCGKYTWIDVKAPVTPLADDEDRVLPAHFGTTWPNLCCGQTFEDIAWASLVRPADPEPFYRGGLIGQDTWQKLADNPSRAYLEPFFRPGPSVGQLGAGVLAYYMAFEDKSVSSLAIEATAVLASAGRLPARKFTDALKPFLMSHTLPTNRWTKAMKTIADLGGATFVRDVIVNLLDFKPEDTPRDIGGLLELCYELHVAQDVNLTNANAKACLNVIPGGGKTARFKKRLLETVVPVS